MYSCDAIRVQFSCSSEVIRHMAFTTQMSEDCTIELNSQLYPGFIDLHGLSSDSGVST